MKNDIKNLVLAALFMALGIVLPFFTGQIPQIGNMLLPMHIPVLLCGFICGWQYGLAVGFATPLLRSMIFGMPVMMPSAIGMAFELAAYGFVTGFLYRKLPKKNYTVYVSLLGAMIIGRIVWGMVSVVLYGIQGNSFSVQIFLSGALLNAIPGIILQIILIPAIMIALNKAGVLRHYETGTI
ncbi:MAG: ECF transporter S component [Lachnospiraceae bacterium]|nr:ECF transporter S component [Lachnospiraceae bacterium]